MRKIKSICVYCGSRPGAQPGYADLARQTGKSLAQTGIILVYGGGQIGLMGLAAREALANGGRVIGIIPEHLDEVEIAQTGLSELHVVADMHARKRMMFDRSDAFIVLPGGLGTLEEFLEMLTWRQLGLHNKPIYLLNYQQYWDPLIALFDHVVDQGFAAPPTTSLFQSIDSLESLLENITLRTAAEHKIGSNSA